MSRPSIEAILRSLEASIAYTTRTITTMVEDKDENKDTALTIANRALRHSSYMAEQLGRLDMLTDLHEIALICEEGNNLTRFERLLHMKLFSAIRNFRYNDPMDQARQAARVACVAQILEDFLLECHTDEARDF